MKNSFNRTNYSLSGILLLYFLSGCTSTPETVTLTDYQRAEKFLSVNTTPLVSGMISGQTWLDSDKLFYKNTIGNGWEYIIANPTAKEKKTAFDLEKLAASLMSFGVKDVKTNELGLSQVEFFEDETKMLFNIGFNRYQADLSSYEISKAEGRKRTEHLSPNGKLAAFIRDNNLWVRNVETKQVTQLTFDGSEDYGYATNNAGWIKSDLPVLLWSPDSNMIATFQHDGRGVGEMYLYNTQVGHSKLEKWKYPLPGDSLIFRIERVVIHLNPKPKVVRLKMPPDAHRSTISDHIAGRGGEFLDVEW